VKKVIPSNSILLPDNAELVFDGIFYSAYHWPQTLFDGSTTTFEMLKRRDTAVTIGVADNKVVVIEEEQPHSGKRTTFPAGSVELSDPDIEYAAKRETSEETGFTFNNWRLIKVVQPANDVEWFVHIWLATDVQDRSQPDPDAGEKIGVNLIEFSEVKRMVMNDDGVMGENRDIFESLNSLEDLLNLPEFIGQTVDR
jgi:8-oxo-dGTP pyrophosphatase MutT (NUDIX family)